MINAAAVALGLLTEAGPPPHIAKVVGEEICASARRAVEAMPASRCRRELLANQYSIQRSGCATTLIGTAKQRHLDSAVAAAEQPIDEGLLADVLAAVGVGSGSPLDKWSPAEQLISSIWLVDNAPEWPDRRCRSRRSKIPPSTAVQGNVTTRDRATDHPHDLQRAGNRRRSEVCV